MTRPFWRARLLPLFLVLLATNTGALAAWTLPRTLRQKNAAARAVTARAELAQDRERVLALRERAAVIKANRGDLERFYSTLAGSRKQDLLKALEAIEQLARAPGLQLASRALRRQEVEGAPLERVTVTLPLEGSYAQLASFLRGVERSKQFLTIDRVSLRADAESGGALQVELSTYQRQPPGAGKAGRRGR
jgi:Tfp pilus assembly protein PilO